MSQAQAIWLVGGVVLAWAAAGALQTRGSTGYDAHGFALFLSLLALCCFMQATR